MEFAEIPEYSQLKECHGNLAGVKQSEKRYRWIQKRGDRIYAEIVVINLGTRKAYV